MPKTSKKTFLSNYGKIENKIKNIKSIDKSIDKSKIAPINQKEMLLLPTGSEQSNAAIEVINNEKPTEEIIELTNKAEEIIELDNKAEEITELTKKELSNKKESSISKKTEIKQTEKADPKKSIKDMTIKEIIDLYLKKVDEFYMKESYTSSDRKFKKGDKKNKPGFHDKYPMLTVPALPEIKELLNIIYSRSEEPNYKVFELILINGLKNTDFGDEI